MGCFDGGHYKQSTDAVSAKGNDITHLNVHGSGSINQGVIQKLFA